MLKIIDQGIISRVEGKGAFMPVIVPLPDGTFIASQHAGKKIGGLDSFIEVLRSPDGKSWTNQGNFHAPSHDIKKWTYMAPRISVVPDGRLVMTATRFDNSTDIFDTETEAASLGQLLLFWSSDMGRTWSDPQVIPMPPEMSPSKYTWNGAGTLLQIAPDRWMYPFETWKPKEWKGLPDQKAGALFSSDQGKTWPEMRVVADDTTGKILWYDQMCELLPDGRIYTLIWTHLYGTQDDVNNHWTVSTDQGRTWAEPKPTNLRGQVCTPIPLKDGRVAAIYNYRHEPQGIHVALTEDLQNFDTKNEVKVFDAGLEATLGDPENENFLSTHMKIAFGKPGGVQLANGDIMTYFWCTTQGVTHTRWALLRAD